jgi:hypothetical protein
VLSGFTLATGCYFKVMKLACECDPSGRRAPSRNLRESGIQGLVPAGRKLFAGSARCAGDDDSY